MHKATFIREMPKSEFRGDARLYALSEPIKWEHYNDVGELEQRIATHVIVSAAVTYSGPETYIFPAMDDGKILNWSELSGSERGILDHVAVLRNAGYDAG